jgi:hypothetical protein
MSGKLQTIIQTNIHGLRSANDTAAFKEKEMPLCQEVWILDEPAWQTLPGYEEAVKRYYKKLAEP